jgi:alpha-galactosidase
VTTSAVSARFRDGDRRGVRYASGPVVLDEELRDGRLYARYWSPCGQVWPEMHLERLRYGVDEPADAFRLGIDGALLQEWTWSGASEVPDTSGYRAAAGRVTVASVRLESPKGIAASILTRLDGSAYFIRWLEVTNRTGRAVGITEVSPWSGVLFSHRFDEHLPPGCDSPFELGYNHLFAWGEEGDFWLEPLRDGVRTVDGGKLGRSGWGRPAFWARDLCTGITSVCELAWGGNYTFSLDSRISRAANNARLFFAMGLSGHDRVLRVLSPGETLRTPEVHLGLFQADTDSIVAATHRHVRTVVMPERIPGRHVEIEANHRGYLCDRENEPDLKRDVEVAASIGAEMYVVDAGWYGNEPNQWWNNTGDWHAGSWLPNGLEPVAAHAKKHGMRFGLWVEIEAAGAASTLRKEHSDWILRRNGLPVNERALDLANPEVERWVESEIARIIDCYGLDMFRIDHNHTLAPSGNRVVEELTEDLTWRYYEALYRVLDRLRARYPAVVFQNCAGGGGRLDWGTLRRFHNTELSDWMRQPRGLRILNGVTLSLPPEILLRTFGTESGEHELDGDVDAQLRLVCLCRPIFRGIAPSAEELTPYLRERIAHHLALYRDFVRPVMVDGRVYHHTPFLPLYQDAPWCVLEYASEDRRRAVVGLFRTSAAGPAEYRLFPRGIDPASSYDLTLDSHASTVRVPGWELVNHGIAVRLDNTMSSELVLLAAGGES